MKKTNLIAAIILVATIASGCSANKNVNETATPEITDITTETTTTANTAVISETTEDTTSDNNEPVEEAALSFNLIGLTGERIKPSEIVKITPIEGETLTAEELTEDNWYYLSCEGFGYITEPTGICCTSIDNPELFDEEILSFVDIPGYSPKEYRRVEPGDEICGLTVATAATDLFRDSIISAGASPDVPGSYFSGSTITFDGTAELTGYLLLPPKDDYHVFEGDMFFVPEEKSCILPVVNFRYNFDEKKVENNFSTSCVGDFYWINEYPTFYVGNMSDTSADISKIPSEGYYHKVRLTVDNIKMFSSINWFSRVECNIVKLEYLG